MPVGRYRTGTMYSLISDMIISCSAFSCKYVAGKSVVVLAQCSLENKHYGSRTHELSTITPKEAMATRSHIMVSL